MDVWCEENGISRKTYYYRLKRVCDMIPEDNQASLPPATVEKPVFAELSQDEQTIERNSVITVRAGGMGIQIPNLLMYRDKLSIQDVVNQIKTCQEYCDGTLS